MSKEREMRMYNLVDEQGGGILMPWVRYGIKTKDFSLLKEFFESMVGQSNYLSICKSLHVRSSSSCTMMAMGSIFLSRNL